MAVKMSQLMNIIEELAPLEVAEDWDNVGLLTGRRNSSIRRVLITLDVLDQVIDEAIASGADAIISHHPLIFTPIKRITDGNPLENRLLRLIENKICLYTAHTNMDAAQGGLNDMLFDVLDLTERKYICESKPGVFAGRAGMIPKPIKLTEFAKFVQGKLNLPTATYCGNGNIIVHKIGLAAGSTADSNFFWAARDAGCDVFVTSDIKYHAAQTAADIGISLVDATHYGSEAIFVQGLKNYLEKHLPQIEFIASKIDGQVFKNACL